MEDCQSADDEIDELDPWTWAVTWAYEVVEDSGMTLLNDIVARPDLEFLIKLEKRVWKHSPPRRLAASNGQAAGKNAHIRIEELLHFLHIIIERTELDTWGAEMTRAAGSDVTSQLFESPAWIAYIRGDRFGFLHAFEDQVRSSSWTYP